MHCRAPRLPSVRRVRGKMSVAPRGGKWPAPRPPHTFSIHARRGTASFGRYSRGPAPPRARGLLRHRSSSIGRARPVAGHFTPDATLGRRRRENPVRNEIKLSCPRLRHVSCFHHHGSVRAPFRIFPFDPLIAHFRVSFTTYRPPDLWPAPIQFLLTLLWPRNALATDRTNERCDPQQRATATDKTELCCWRSVRRAAS